MQLEQLHWSADSGWQPIIGPYLGAEAHLVLLFAAPGILRDPACYAAVRLRYPAAALLGCSTGGEICGTRVFDDTAVVTALHFAHTRVRTVQVSIPTPEASCAAGEQLACRLAAPDLQHVFVLSEGVHINGSELVQGLVANLPDQVAVTGGLSADGPDFRQTLVCADGPPAPRIAGAVGFYGRHLHIGYGSLGGWDPFGPERVITRAEGSLLYELDGRPALRLYKQFLGTHAADLPASGLLFPLSLRTADGRPGIVRTILGVDEATESLRFAGDMPVGATARLMRANFDRLLDGATDAARISHEALGSAPPDLAILISCVGRKWVLKQRIEEEVEGVREVLGDQPIFTGFYSYGEISPFTPATRCELHNQTMTITTLREADDA